MKSKSVITPTQEKKLKQARLPFQVLSPRATGSDGPPAKKKRKLSSSVEENHNIKKVAYVKQNLGIESPNNEIISLDTEDDIPMDINLLKEKKLDQTNVESNVQDTTKGNCSVRLIKETLKSEVSGDSFETSNSSVCDKNSELLLDKPNILNYNDNILEQGDNKDCNSHSTSQEEVSKDESQEHDDNDIIEFCSENEQENNSSSNISLSPNANEKILDADDSPECNENVDSTPKRRNQRRAVNVESTSAEMKKTPDIKKSLTPKQLQRKLLFAKMREDKEKARQELSRKKQDEREERIKKKQQKEEERRKEREEKEEERKKEREEKEKKRLAESEKRNEEKRLKDEEKRMKDEEKRIKDEQREEERKKKDLEKEEAEIKKKKAAAAFVNFFVPKRLDEKKSEEEINVSNVSVEELDESKSLNFMPFCVKGDMRLAPLVRSVFSKERRKYLEDILDSKISSKINNYMELLKENKQSFRKSGKTWAVSEDAKDDLIVIDECGESFVEVLGPSPTYKAKLILFHENRRPPYWGTWTKKSADVGPRTPLGKDSIIDYEIDSDSEWEEEEPGESLHGSDDEKEKGESEDEYEVDNDFFVPHGYLSDEEQNDEEQEADTPETQKAKLKILQTEFNAEMKKKTEKIKPRLVGCIWATDNGERPENCAEVIWNLLCRNKMIIEDAIVLTAPIDTSCSATEVSAKKSLSEDVIPDLIKLTHGNINGRKFLVKEFQAHLSRNCDIRKDDKTSPEVSNVAISRKIKEIGQYKMCLEETTNDAFRCWCVDKSFRDKYNLSNLSLINGWKYILTPKRQSETIITTDSSKKPEKMIKTKINIKKFTKVLSVEDRQKQFIPFVSGNTEELACPTSAHFGTNSLEKSTKSVKRKRATKKRKVSTSSVSNVPSSSSEKTKNEMVKPNLTIKSTNAVTEKPLLKKRAVLISVPLGTQIPSKARNSLFTSFAKIGDTIAGKIPVATCGATVTDEACVIIDSEEINTKTECNHSKKMSISSSNSIGESCANFVNIDPCDMDASKDRIKSKLGAHIADSIKCTNKVTIMEIDSLRIEDSNDCVVLSD